MMGLTAYEIIRGKREGRTLTSSEIEFMVGGFLDGSVEDYQMSAFLMAVFFRGMSEEETETLTRVMLDSGAVLPTGSIEGVKVDKHSTGGVGDKLSLVCAPIAAAAGVKVPMISGRGLGHTGGTLDKLESIPGFSTSFPPDEVLRLVAEVGMAIVGQSPEMAPADRKMYALRDVTATIECPPLIVGSILSKKLAAGLDALVLDVKVGRGAFMGNVDAARDLATRLISTARRLGLHATAVLSDMESPLGRTVGNALEVRESIDVLKGGGPADVRDLGVELAARMMLLARIEPDLDGARRAAVSLLDGGQALELFARFVEAQGGDASIVDRPDALPETSVRVAVPASTGGFVQRIDAMEIGLAAVALGAGREAVGDAVDPAVGIEIEAVVGTRVERGDPLAFLHVRDEGSVAGVDDRVGRAFVVGEKRVDAGSRVMGTFED